jgi:hypothetical protein
MDSEPQVMTELEYAQKVRELDRLLNDPEVRLDPDRVWSLLADVSRAFRPQSARAA